MNHKLNIPFFKRYLKEKVIPNYNRYVELCRKRGLVPKPFEEWAVPIPKDSDALDEMVFEEYRRFIGNIYREITEGS